VETERPQAHLRLGILYMEASLTALAHEFGYTDQAHFIHDFRAFANRTPGEFAKEMRAIQDIFRDHHNVVFLQVPTAGRH
jgi:AraC-like DNA-binding protein